MEEERFARLNHRDSETSLDPTHFRMYASGQGRWLTPDSLMGHPFNPQTFDRYSYAGGNPTNRVDPAGLYPIQYGGCVYDETDFFVNGQYDSSPYELVGCGFAGQVGLALYPFFAPSYGYYGGYYGGGGGYSGGYSSGTNVQSTATPTHRPFTNEHHLRHRPDRRCHPVFVQQ
jgi:RHS repeat-associated protein